MPALNKIWSDIDELKRLVLLTDNLTSLIESCGLNPKGAETRKRMNLMLQTNNINISHFRHIRSTDRWADCETLTKYVTESVSFTEVLQKMKIPHRSGNFTTLKRYLKKYGISTDHFNASEAITKTKIKNGTNLPFDLNDILDGKYPEYRTTALKQRLIQSGIFQNSCSKCNIDKWCGEDIVLELDHIDGNSKNHRRDNLRLLCPNCHSQTLTFKGRNKKKHLGPGLVSGPD